MRPAHAVLPSLAALALLAGCGGGSSSDSSSTVPAAAPSSGGGGGGGKGTVVNLSADPSGALKFDKTKITVPAGKVTLVMKNPSTVTHAIGVEGNGVDQDGQDAAGGETSTVTLNLKPGTYEFYCPVDGHEAAGMKGTLVVT